MKKKEQKTKVVTERETDILHPVQVGYEKKFQENYKNVMKGAMEVIAEKLASFVKKEKE